LKSPTNIRDCAKKKTKNSRSLQCPDKQKSFERKYIAVSIREDEMPVSNYCSKGRMTDKKSDQCSEKLDENAEKVDQIAHRIFRRS
jgi:N-acetylglucosamine kinase-like BadF-type ATPase